MLISRCDGCKAQIQKAARICPKCGALTGVPMSSNDEPISFGWMAFIVALAIAATYLLFMNWVAS
jgi:predicted amidophosphoribosyltransferase